MENFSYKNEVCRKLFHVFYILSFAVSCFFFTKKVLLLFVFPIAILVVSIDFYRHKIPALKSIFDKCFGLILRDHEKEEGLTGGSYFCIAALVVLIFSSKAIAVAAFSILAISDTAASLIGRRLKSEKFFEKSVAGSASFFISAIIILVTVGIILNEHFDYYCFGAVAVIVTTIIEARPSFLKLDDNLTIPLSFAFIMFIFDLIWVTNY